MSEKTIYEINGKKYKTVELCLAQDELLTPIVEKLDLGSVLPELASLAGIDVSKEDYGMGKDAFATMLTSIGKFAKAAFEDSGLRDFLSIILIAEETAAFDATAVDEIKMVVGGMKNSQIAEVLVNFFVINRSSIISFLSSLNEIAENELAINKTTSTNGDISEKASV